MMRGINGQSEIGEAVVPASGHDLRVLVMPHPGECQGHADDLRDMLAAGELDQRVVRAAANAFEAIAAGSRVGIGIADFTPQAAPFSPPEDRQ